MDGRKGIIDRASYAGSAGLAWIRMHFRRVTAALSGRPRWFQLCLLVAAAMLPGRTAAHKAGRKSGRKPKLNATQQRRARELMSQGQGVRGVADEMNVHYSTISRLR